ncbi:MAG: glycosyltransferase family 4 protein [Gemmataceae bacterium]
MSVRQARSADSSIFSASAAMRRWSAASERSRVLLVARWPIGGVRTHLLSNYSALCEAGFRFTFVGPAGEALYQLRAGFEGIDGLGFVGVPVEDRRCRLWPTVRSLLREGRFGLLHSHGLTATAHAALANLGIGVPHLATVLEPLRPNQFSGWMGCMKRWMLRRALLQTDAIVIASEDARANLIENVPCLRDRTQRLFTVAEGIGAERLTALMESLLNRTPLTFPSEPLAA